MLLPLALLAQAAPAPVIEHGAADAVAEIRIEAGSAEMFVLADRALAAGDEAFARRILLVLTEDRERSVRNEARFRLASLAFASKEWARAGTLLRAILDEEPGAQRARLELARVQTELGEFEAARRTLREAQAGGLPPHVARLVDRFSAGLRERRSHGASVRFAFAPDSNINRATRSDTLGTVFGDFDLDEDARKTSGIGVSLEAGAFGRARIGAETSLLIRAGFSGDFYRDSRFADVLATLSAGPEFALAGGRATTSVGAQVRWFGSRRFYHAYNAAAHWQKPLGRRTHLVADMAYARHVFAANGLQNAHSLSGAVGIERALGARGGIGASLGALRQVARDPAYSSTSGQVSATGWMDVAAMTLFAVAGYQRSENDVRLLIYPERRKDDFFRASVGATLRKLNWRGWAPQLKLTWERNLSTIEVYDYNRWRGEIGIARAF